jgi:hypothetical protein
MSYVIDSRQILANVLRTRHEVTVKELKSLAARIAEQLPDVAVDISHYSLSAALESFPKMFKRQDETTITSTPYLCEILEERSFEIFFNQEIPPEIRTRFLKCIGS